MADIRIKDLAVTASASSSDDYLAVDGSTNGTRKLSAYSPTFGGNLTVSGTGTSSFSGDLTFATNKGIYSAVQNGRLYLSGDSAGAGAFIQLTGSSFSTPNNVRIDANTGTISNLANTKNSTWDINQNWAIAGNLTVSGTTIGLGVTPSAWDGTLIKAIQLADNGASLSSFSTGNTSNKFAILSNNAYYDSGGWKYLQTAGTAQYRVANQEHLWYSAASGTAGNAITFTERMKLDSSGNLTVSGGTITSGSGTLTLNSSANTVVLQSAGTTALTLDSSQRVVIANATNNGSRFTMPNNSAITWNNAANSGDGGSLYFDNTNALQLRTGSGASLALTLDSSQNATFAGSIAINNTVQTAVSVASTHKVTISIGGSTYYLLATNV